jgi:predicted HicB family RNase H-like nuclease
MKYTELVSDGATETEKQEFLVGGDMTTVTLRIPRHLKEAGAEAAALKGISFSAYVRMCMLDDLTKERR